MTASVAIRYAATSTAAGSDGSTIRGLVIKGFDANGILNVGAVDKATGREQKITITASTNLDENVIDRMTQEAQKHKAEDEKRRELITAKNNADSSIYTAEKALKDLGDKIDDETKQKVEDGVERVRAVLEGDDAEKIKAALIAKGEDIEDVSGAGDGIMLQNYYPEKDQAEIQKQFGSGFAEALVELSLGQWHGPVLSGYGVHLVYVHSIAEPPAIAFEDVRERVTLDWETEKGVELNKQFYDSLRQRYTVVIEEPTEADRLTVMKELEQ